MAEEVVTSMSASSMATPDHNKRKHEELELNKAPKPPTESDSNAKLEPGTVEVENEGDDESEAKRPRLEMETSNGNEPDGDELATQNDCQKDVKTKEPKEEEYLQPGAGTNNAQSEEEESLTTEAEDNNVQPEEGQELSKEALETVTSEQAASDENEQPENESAQEQEESRGEVQEPSVEVLREGDVQTIELQPGSTSQVLSLKMEVPNDKSPKIASGPRNPKQVGVLIGKAGDTIMSLQDNSGAKIQIVRDADADPRSVSRPVELIGTLRNITKAEKLIKDIIAEADAGGSPSLVARGFSTAQTAAGGEQLEIQVPNEKIGLIIGKGGETIKNLQTRSGARIQLIPQHLPEGDQFKDRTVRVTGNKKQIEMASEMMKEVMNQTVRPSSLSGGYSQQAFRPRGPASSQWGSLGPHHAQFSRYNQQRGSFPSQNPQYPTPSYGNYPPQQAPRGSFGPSWEQRPPVAMQVPSPQANYNYGQPQGPDYGQPTPYSLTPVQHYGHGYGEVKYDHHASAQHYRQMVSQPIVYAHDHPSPATASSAYPQQAAQLVAGYGQPGGQQPPAYTQTGPAGGYPYPTSLPGYTEQPAANNAAYSYQAPADLAYGSAQAPSAYAASTPGQLGYGQTASTQPGYDQSIPQPAGLYAGVPTAARYGKSASPQPVYPQYDETQTYAAHR